MWMWTRNNLVCVKSARPLDNEEVIVWSPCLNVFSPSLVYSTLPNSVLSVDYSRNGRAGTMVQCLDGCCHAPFRFNRTCSIDETVHFYQTKKSVESVLWKYIGESPSTHGSQLLAQSSIMIEKLLVNIYTASEAAWLHDQVFILETDPLLISLLAQRESKLFQGLSILLMLKYLFTFYTSHMLCV